MVGLREAIPYFIFCVISASLTQLCCSYVNICTENVRLWATFKCSHTNKMFTGKMYSGFRNYSDHFVLFFFVFCFFFCFMFENVVYVTLPPELFEWPSGGSLSPLLSRPHLPQWLRALVVKHFPFKHERGYYTIGNLQCRRDLSGVRKLFACILACVLNVYSIFRLKWISFLLWHSISAHSIIQTVLTQLYCVKLLQSNKESNKAWVE